MTNDSNILGKTYDRDELLGDFELKNLQFSGMADPPTNAVMANSNTTLSG